MAAQQKKGSKKAAAKPKGPDTTLGPLGSGALGDVVNGTQDGKLVGDLDWRYEDIFQQMFELQWWKTEASWYTPAADHDKDWTVAGAIARDQASEEWSRTFGDRRRRTYYFKDWGNRTSLVKAPSGGARDGTPLYFPHDGTDFFAGHPGRINCTGSTESATVRELERKYAQWQVRNTPVAARLSLADVKKHGASFLPPFSSHQEWVRNSLTAQGAPAALGMRKVGFQVLDPADARRGDVAQSFPKDGGHGVFVWDRRLDDDDGPTVRYQQLSSQYHFTDGIGVNHVFNEESSEQAWKDAVAAAKAAGTLKKPKEATKNELPNAICPPAATTAWDPSSYAYARRALRTNGAWQPPTTLKFGVGRYYRLFPYWPLARGDAAVTAAPNLLAAAISNDGQGWYSNGTFASGGPGSFDQGGTLVQTSSSNPTIAPLAAQRMWDLAEGRAGASADGYYPISTNRTWHAGVHLPTDAPRSVHAMADGVIVAARMATAKKNGPSASFVLLRHDVKIADATKTFFCLYMHLDPSKKDQELLRSRWCWKIREGADALSAKMRAKLDAGEVLLLAEPVAAGDIVGHVGGADFPFLHWEVFSIDPIDNPAWQKVEDESADLFVELKAGGKKLLDEIAVAAGHVAAGDAVVKADEIRKFYAATDKDQALHQKLRNTICKHRSEWLHDVVQKAADVKRHEGLTEGAQETSDELAWWGALAGHGGGKALPSDATVWTYHPITFSLWLATQVGIDPVGKQVVQDAKSFVATAVASLSGGDAPPPNPKRAEKKASKHLKKKTAKKG